MNYLNFLEQKDIEKMLEQCNLKLNKNVVEPIRTCKDSFVALIFCEKINLETEDLIKQKLFDRITSTYPMFKSKNFSYFDNNIVLFMSNFELFDGIYEKDYTDVLYQTLTTKLANNPKLLKKYKNDFVKYYKKLEKQYEQNENSK